MFRKINFIELGNDILCECDKVEVAKNLYNASFTRNKYTHLVNVRQCPKAGTTYWKMYDVYSRPDDKVHLAVYTGRKYF